MNSPTRKLILFALKEVLRADSLGNAKGVD